MYRRPNWEIVENFETEDMREWLPKRIMIIILQMDVVLFIQLGNAITCIGADTVI